MYSDYAVVELLISKGAEISGGRTLEFAIIYGKGNPRIKVIQLLISHGVNVNAEFQGSGKSALLMVSESIKANQEDEEIAQLLIANGANVNYRIPTGWYSFVCSHTTRK